MKMSNTGRATMTADLCSSRHQCQNTIIPPSPQTAMVRITINGSHLELLDDKKGEHSGVRGGGCALVGVCFVGGNRHILYR